MNMSVSVVYSALRSLQAPELVYIILLIAPGSRSRNSSETRIGGTSRLNVTKDRLSFSFVDPMIVYSI